MNHRFNILSLVLLRVRAAFTVLVPAAAPTSADTATLGDLMKEVYDPVIAEQQNLEASTWKDFEDGDDELGGEGWFFMTTMGGNQEGIGARAERGDLPSAGRQRQKQGKIYWKNVYGTFELTGQAIKAAQSNLFAFAQARTHEIEGLTRDVIKDLNRQILGDGTAHLATVTAETSTTVFTVDNGQYLRLNMLIQTWDAGAPATNLEGTNSQITGLTPNADGTMTVTVDVARGGTARAAGDKVARAGNRYDSGGGVMLSNEITGMQEIFDDGTIAATFETISRTTYPLWKGHVLDNGGTLRNLTLDLIQQAEDMVSIASGGRPDWIRTGFGQRRKFFDLVSGDRRYNSKTFDAGYETLTYNGMAVTIDVDMPKSKMFVCKKGAVRKYSLMKLGIMDLDGNVLRQVSGKDLWRGHLGMYANLGSKHPNHGAIITDLTEPVQDQWVW